MCPGEAQQRGETVILSALLSHCIKDIFTREENRREEENKEGKKGRGTKSPAFIPVKQQRRRLDFWFELRL